MRRLPSDHGSCEEAGGRKMRGRERERTREGGGEREREREKFIDNDNQEVTEGR
jgi:hypothetical protein